MAQRRAVPKEGRGEKQNPERVFHSGWGFEPAP